MEKTKYKIGDTLYWYSIIEGKVISGKVEKIEGPEYTINVKGIRWAVNEYKLSKRKTVGYRESPANKIMKGMNW